MPNSRSYWSLSDKCRVGLAQDVVLGLEFLHFQNQGGRQRTLGTIVCDRVQYDPCQPRTKSPGLAQLGRFVDQIRQKCLPPANSQLRNM